MKISIQCACQYIFYNQQIARMYYCAYTLNNNNEIEKKTNIITTYTITSIYMLKLWQKIACFLKLTITKYDNNEERAKIKHANYRFD